LQALFCANHSKSLRYFEVTSRSGGDPDPNGEKLVGVWYDETGIYEKSRRGEKVDRKDFATVYAIELAPLPCWADLSPQEYRRQVRELVEGLVEEEQARRPREGRTVLGAEAVMAQDPRRAPEKLSRSSAEIGFQSLGREYNTMEHYEEQDYLHCQA